MSINIIVVESKVENADAIVEDLYQIVDLERCDMTIRKFSDCRESIQFVEEEGCDIAFVMVDGIRFSPQSFVKSLQRLNPRMNIIFCGREGGFLKDSWNLGLSGYVSLPAKKKDLLFEISELRYYVWLPIRDELLALKN